MNEVVKTMSPIRVVWMKKLKHWYVILVFVLCPSMAIAVEVGSLEEDVYQELGEPLGVSIFNDRKTLFYEGGGIEVLNGTVRSIEANFYRTAKARRDHKEFETSQRSKGLIKYEGEWITPQKLKAIEYENQQVEARQRLKERIQRAHSSRSCRHSVGSCKKKTQAKKTKTAKRVANKKKKKLSSFQHGLDKKPKKRKVIKKKKRVVGGVNTYLKNP